MNIQIQNVSYSSAAVTWSAIPHCPESFYHIIYRPNWNSIFSGYARPNFHFEETVPHSATSLLLEKLSPSTTYILCITCKSTYPSSDHCTTFNTVGDNPLILSRMGLGMNNVVWMMSCILFLLLLSVLIYSCLHCWCSKQHTQLGKYTSAAFPTSPGQYLPTANVMKRELRNNQNYEVPLTNVKNIPMDSNSIIIPITSSYAKHAIQEDRKTGLYK